MQNQAGMFNVGNQMTAQNANFNAGQQSQMYNQGQRTQAAGQLGSYNNQRQGMLSDAEGRQIGVVGQQVFRGPETGLPQGQQPNFQQWQSGGGSNNKYAPGYGQPWTAPMAWGPSKLISGPPTGTNTGSMNSGGAIKPSLQPMQIQTTKPVINNPMVNKPAVNNGFSVYNKFGANAINPNFNARDY
jgi:hypothetical protein